ncbi:SymE family type I addiction module toxin, partial [Erwinia amylovora]|uniref:SymE family type I addiction module toxin n=1 Tax=Erwinia amylovora TaxID=552 RepID=UPI001178B09F
SITLKGHWMAELGFETGQEVEVITEPGQLIIRLAGEGELTDYKVKSRLGGRDLLIRQVFHLINY